jgi:pimeloyl-ACP methyl ester carboxylesterase
VRRCARRTEPWRLVVVAIDHPYDADIVEFPDGRVVLRGQQPEGPTTNATAVAVRADDTHFVLDQLPAFDTAPAGLLRGDLDLQRVGMFGHSMGGATAAAAMLTDRRIAAGVNLDGTFYGPVVSAGLDRPFLLMSSAGHNIRTDPSWASTWANLRGWRRDLELADSGHLTYSDIAVLYGPLHLSTVVPQAAVGTIDGVRAVDVEQTYLTAYFDHFLLHAPTRLLEHPDPRYPEVLFLG